MSSSDDERARYAQLSQLIRILLDPEADPSGQITSDLLGGAVWALEEDFPEHGTRWRDLLAKGKPARDALDLATAAYTARTRSLGKLNGLVRDAEGSQTDPEKALELAAECASATDRLLRFGLATLFELDLLESVARVSAARVREKRQEMTELARRQVNKRAAWMDDRDRAIRERFASLRLTMPAKAAAIETAEWLDEHHKERGWKPVGPKRIQEIAKNPAATRKKAIIDGPPAEDRRGTRPRKCRICRSDFWMTKERRHTCSEECEAVRVANLQDEFGTLDGAESE